MSTPTLPAEALTDRLRLCRPRTEDLEALVVLVGDPRVPDAQFPARFRTPSATAQALDRAMEHWERERFGPWLVRRRSDDALVGRVGLMSAVFEDRPCVEVKWFVGVSAWGQGFATEAARAAVGLGFSRLGLDEVLAWTLTTNDASQAVMRRLGFTCIGPFERAGLPHVAFRLVRDVP